MLNHAAPLVSASLPLNFIDIFSSTLPFSLLRAVSLSPQLSFAHRHRPCVLSLQVVNFGRRASAGRLGGPGGIPRHSLALPPLLGYDILHLDGSKGARIETRRLLERERWVSTS